MQKHHSTHIMIKCIMRSRKGMVGWGRVIHCLFDVTMNIHFAFLCEYCNISQYSHHDTKMYHRRIIMHLFLACNIVITCSHPPPTISWSNHSSLSCNYIYYCWHAILLTYSLTRNLFADMNFTSLQHRRRPLLPPNKIPSVCTYNEEIHPNLLFWTKILLEMS